MRILFVCCAIVSAPSFAFSTETSPLDVYGTWMTRTENSKIEITDCGDNTPCGKIIWVNDPEPVLLRDKYNKDAALRDRPIVGMTILEGFTATKNQWKKGEIYDPESGKTYGAKLRRLPDGVLQVRGCIGPICQTQHWTVVGGEER